MARSWLFPVATAAGNHQNTPNGSWSGWSNLGGSWSQDNDIAIANNANGEEEIFMVGNTDNLYNNWQTSPNNKV